MGTLISAGLRVLIALLCLSWGAFPVSAQPVGCPFTVGYSGYFTQPSYVAWFTWNAETAFMLVALTQEIGPNYVVIAPSYHGFVNVSQSIAQQFAILGPTQTQSFYQSRVATGHEALLMQQTLNSVTCGLQYESPPNGPAPPPAQLNIYLWTR